MNFYRFSLKIFNGNKMEDDHSDHSDHNDHNINYECIIKPLLIITAIALIFGYGGSTVLTILTKTKK